MDEHVTLYTLPGCMQCTMTERALSDAGVGFAVVDLASDERAVDLVKQLGYLSAPVVDGAQHWSGFDPERIRATAARRSAEQLLAVSNA
ncbi:glutaredoxin family protein [Herbiconiux daphne]|uniref:Glutaredoxin family protein n=1 Tax=Herbiconiux daphne TaxID=2970914 RepID=A0ABT2H6U8_9MICO|nr:glutaredoxin family protein [Herbiconiux daphne]MCS5735675.1 glutaredoxin family protein [Herbiconiux daphne]